MGLWDLCEANFVRCGHSVMYVQNMLVHICSDGYKKTDQEMKALRNTQREDTSISSRRLVEFGREPMPLFERWSLTFKERVFLDRAWTCRSSFRIPLSHSKTLNLIHQLGCVAYFSSVWRSPHIGHFKGRQQKLPLSLKNLSNLSLDGLRFNAVFVEGSINVRHSLPRAINGFLEKFW